MNTSSNSRESSIYAQSKIIQDFFSHSGPFTNAAHRIRVEQFLKDSEMEMEGYTRDINYHKSVVALLEHKRDWLRNQMEKFRSLLAPVHRLPSEILSHIFKFCCEENRLQIGVAAPYILLSSVCRRWREAVLSDPSLAASITIDLSVEKWGGIEGWPTMDSAFRFFIKRSKSHPMHLSLDFKDGSQIESSYNRVMKNLLMTSDRWCTLSLLGVSQSMIRLPIFRAIRGNLSKLQSLDIMPTDEDEEAIDPDSCNLFGDCPSLTSLRLRPRGFFTVHCRLPWAQLDTLHLHRCSVLHALPFVELAQGVTRLELINVGGTDPYPQDPITSRAELLLIVAKNQSEVSKPLQNLTLYQMSSLEICGLRSRPPVTWAWDQTPISNMLLRSQSASTLTSLTLKFLPVTDGQTIELLQMLPALQRLCIEECYSRGNQIVTTSLLKEVTVDHNRSTATFLPNLTQLTLLIHPGTSDDLSVLRKAVTSRWIPDDAYASVLGVACIKALEVIFLDGTGNNEAAERLALDLEWIAQAGARINVGCRVIQGPYTR